MQKSKQRMKKGARAIETERAHGQIDEQKAAERATAMNAAVLLARCRPFRAKLWHGSRFGHANTLATPVPWRRQYPGDEPCYPWWQLEQQCVQLHRR